MSNINSFEFLLGAVVSVVANSGIVYVGTLLEVRHSHNEGVGVQFLYIQLTVAVGNYVVGEIVAININDITSIGPVAAS